MGFIPWKFESSPGHHVKSLYDFVISDHVARQKIPHKTLPQPGTHCLDHDSHDERMTGLACCS